MARPEGGTEIVLIAPDERTMAMHAAREMPTIGNMNVTNSKKIHVGPKFVSVNQTIENKEMIKGHILGLELVSTATSRRLRCSVAVFLCWAFLVSSGIAFYLFYLTLNKQQVRLDIGLNETWYLRREEWQALKNYELNFLQLPVKYVLVGHSAANYCKERYACIKSMLAIQEDHLKRGWDDIGPNFLVGGNGLVFEGRGANLIGAMVRSWNKKSVTIMFIGDYRTDKATPLQIEHVNILLKKLVEVGVLTPDFELYGHCQITKLIISPGPNVMKSLRNVTNWISRDEDKCLPDLPLPKYLWKLITNTSRAERLACAASVTTMIVVILLVVYYTVYMRTVESDVVDVAPHPWNISREMWLALPPTGNRTTDHYDPLKIVIIGHTVSSECHTFKECAAELRRMQGSFINDLQYDIPYNFLVGNDGRVYEGRGWNIEGAHTFGFNRCALGIGFIGDYREELESHSKHTQKQLDNVMLLFQEGIKRGHLASDFYVVGARDVGNLKESPGSDLYNAIQKWDFFDHKRQFRNRTCDEIYERV